MATAPNKKRKRQQTTGLHAQAEKRQRIQPAPKKARAVDALAWNAIQLPETFEDAEGFYGLEEVENVEVIRQDGAVQFLAAVDASNDAADDEFQGFSDDAVGATKSKKKPTMLSRAKADAETSASRPSRERSEEVTTAKTAKQKNRKQDKHDTTDDLGPGQGAFTLLGNSHEAKGVDISAWRDLELSDEILSGISKLGFATPTKIQEAAIGPILAGHDVVGKASTGSGKTLAFGIPIVQSWLERCGELPVANGGGATVTALILSPTRELAHQLARHMKDLCLQMPSAPRVIAITGGMSAEKQQRQMLAADVIVATPGRLWDLMSSVPSTTDKLRTIRFLVLDEADRLLADGHFKELEEIISALDRQDVVEDDDADAPSANANRQTLVFSATLDKHLQKRLAGKSQRAEGQAGTLEYLLAKLKFREERPTLVDVNPTSQMAERLKESIVECGGTEKDLYLYAVLMYHRQQRVLVFTNSVHCVRRLTPMLQSLNIPAQALHSQMIQKARLRAVERFSAPNSQGSVLVATDVAARGLDIKGIQLIIHYHLPRTADTYIHRSGRTARSEMSGSSILLCAPEEVVGTRRLIAKVHAKKSDKQGLTSSMQSMDVDRRVVAKLSPRVELAKKITESMLAKAKKGHQDDWLKTAAEELGVDYDSDELDAGISGRQPRGGGRKLKDKQARSLTKADLAALRAELKTLLATRINVGVSERYLASGVVDVDELLRGGNGDFLGKVDGLGGG